MATNPSSLPENVGRITAPNAAYPYGSAKDDSSGTTGDGTPIKKAMLNDTYGFFQAAMQAAGITPSGDAETAEASQVLQALLGVCGGIADKKQWPTIANGVDVDHDIVFSAGKMPDSTGTRPIVTAGLTKRLDGAWAVGNGTGGLFTGTAAGSTTYHCFLIVNDVDGTVDAGFDTSPVAANRPAGHTFFRRIASLYTAPSGGWVQFYQSGDFFGLDQSSFEGSLSMEHGGSGVLAAGAPKGLTSLMARGRVKLSRGTVVATSWALIAPTGTSAQIPSAQISTCGVTAGEDNAGVVVDALLDASGEVRLSLGTAGQPGTSSVSFNTFGWIDDRSE